jgi:hypothetical protein
MACYQCENVAFGGPTQDQQDVDPFEAVEEPRAYQCAHCGQWWWCTAEPRIGYWVRITHEVLLATLNGQAVMVSGGEAILAARG